MRRKARGGQGKGGGERRGRDGGKGREGPVKV